MSNLSSISILHEEPHFLIANKPAGLLTQAIEGIESLQSILIQQLKLRDNHPGAPFVGLPHRLDRGTSGVVLVARNQRALRRLGDQFHHRLVRKFYLVWLEGELPLGNGAQLWSDHLRKIENVPQAEIVSADSPGAKLAEMSVRNVCSDGKQSLALVQLLTGRMHQIRLQFTSRGWPVVGDQLYGAQSILSHAEDQRHRPHGLHALRIEFRHPQTALKCSATAPLPDYWQQNRLIYQAGNELYQQSLVNSVAGSTWGDL